MLGTKIYKPLQNDKLPVYEDVEYQVQNEVGETVTLTRKEITHYEDNPAPNTLSKYSELAAWCNANNAMIDDNGDYYECVAIPEPTQSEKAERIRAERDALLHETDYLVMPDYPLSSEEKAQVVAYRTALRDLPEQAGFPENVVFPNEPEFLAKRNNNRKTL